MKEELKLLTVKEVREKYNISRQTLDRAAKAGKLEKITFAGGKKIYFNEDNILKLFTKTN